MLLAFTLCLYSPCGLEPHHTCPLSSDPQHTDMWISLPPCGLHILESVSPHYASSCSNQTYPVYPILSQPFTQSRKPKGVAVTCKETHCPIRPLPPDCYMTITRPFTLSTLLQKPPSHCVSAAPCPALPSLPPPLVVAAAACNLST